MKDENKKYSAVNSSVNRLLHEIKNPLTICKGYLEMFEEGDSASKEKYKEIIEEEIMRTLALINDYKESQKIEKEELDLSVLLEDIQNTLKSLFQKNNSEIKITQKDELYINGDYNRLKQVFINILKNSLEAKDKEKLQIIIDTKKKKDSYQISITDNGCGMSKKELDSIYQEYYTTKQYGTGLGASFIKEIIELHDGKIEYKSKKGVGTRVLICLPI